MTSPSIISSDREAKRCVNQDLPLGDSIISAFCSNTTTLGARLRFLFPFTAKDVGTQRGTGLTKAVGLVAELAFLHRPDSKGCPLLIHVPHLLDSLLLGLFVRSNVLFSLVYPHAHDLQHRVQISQLQAEDAPGF